jgi:hypothetical protein
MGYQKGGFFSGVAFINLFVNKEGWLSPRKIEA